MNRFNHVALVLFLACAGTLWSQSSPLEKQTIQAAASLDDLVKPEGRDLIVDGAGGAGKAKSKPLDPKKFVPKAAEMLKINSAVIFEGLKTRKLSEIVYAKHLAEKKSVTLDRLLAQKETVLSVESLRNAGVALEPVKKSLDELYTELAFLGLDQLNPR